MSRRIDSAMSSSHTVIILSTIPDAVASELQPTVGTARPQGEKFISDRMKFKQKWAKRITVRKGRPGDFSD